MAAAILDPDEQRENELIMWQQEHARLLGENRILQAKNSELEDRLLDIVEKTEREKIMLSDEIDELSRRLTSSSNRVVQLETECASYKADCVRAVSLLRCHPEHGTDGGTYHMPLSVYGKHARKKSIGSQQQHPMHTSSSTATLNSTFPPTAMYFGIEPDDPVPTQDDEMKKRLRQTSSCSTTGGMSSDEAFVDRIRQSADPGKPSTTTTSDTQQQLYTAIDITTTTSGSSEKGQSSSPHHKRCVDCARELIQIKKLAPKHDNLNPRQHLTSLTLEDEEVVEEGDIGLGAKPQVHHL